MGQIETKTDVVVAGHGNAALSAALAARENGAEVIVLEKSPENEKGGNSRYTHGSIRFAYEDINEIREIVTDLTDEEAEKVDFGSYTADDFYEDMGRLTKYRTNPDLAEVLVDESFETMKWLTEQGVRFTPIYGRQAYKVNGVFKFWGGMVLESVGGGEGLIDSLLKTAERKGIKFRYDAMATELLHDDTGIKGLKYIQNGVTKEIESKAVILATGGFHANAEMRTKYLGPGWDLARVRGSRYNTGEGIQMAMKAGALPHGHWSGAHSVGGDLNAPEFVEGFQKLSYPFGLIVNANGERFVDEGADFRNYTYAKYGRAILEQPDQFAWQVFDRKVAHLLREEYKGRGVTRVTANSLEELAEKMDGVSEQGFLSTIEEYNRSVKKEVEFNPTIRDGKSTVGLTIPKTNWANPIDTPPFEAYAVTCGVTFTYGGLKINTKAEVQNLLEQSIPGLYAAGELVGGLFYFNYPGGAGLMAGSVFGRRAGNNAAIYTSKLYV